MKVVARTRDGAVVAIHASWDAALAAAHKIYPHWTWHDGPDYGEVGFDARGRSRFAIPPAGEPDVQTDDSVWLTEHVVDETGAGLQCVEPAR